MEPHLSVYSQKNIDIENNLLKPNNMCDPKQQAKMEFVSFCIEQYKKATKLNGAETEQMFLQRGVIDFLLEHYEVLHTQGERAIMNEIDEYLKHHQQ